MHAVNQIFAVVSKKYIPVRRNEHPDRGAVLDHVGELGDLESQSKRKQKKFNSTEFQVLLSGTEQVLLT